HMKNPQIKFTNNQTTQPFKDNTTQLLLPPNSSSSFIIPTNPESIPLPGSPTLEHINNLIKGSSTEFQEGLRKGEILVKTLESSRDPRILYKKEFELDDLTLGTWKHIANEIRKRNTDQVAEKYCKTYYEIDSTLEGRFFDRRKLTWWEKEGKFVKNEKVLKEIYRIKESDGFREDLKKAYPDPPGYEDEDFLKEIDDTVSTLYE